MKTVLSRVSLAASAGALAVTLAVGTPHAASHGDKADIVDTAVAAGQFSTLVAAVQAAGLVETLKGEGPFTVFAPTDEAFAKLPEGTVASLLQPENRDQLVSVLTYHVVAGAITSDAAVPGETVQVDTVQGQPISITVSDGTVMVNEKASVVTADVMASNGVIHVIDTVILPE
ncbi:MAG: fasciclin domain-containing protein [Rhodospirillales bacterium]|nr:MAG: fasciclin domain-containing protein [Rhodospirillales bacterium]